MKTSVNVTKQQTDSVQVAKQGVHPAKIIHAE